MIYKRRFGVTSVLLGLGLCAVVLLAATPASAATVAAPDQSYSSDNSPYYFSIDNNLPSTFQTFTAGVSGNMTHVELELSQSSIPDIDAILGVFATDANGLPTDLEHPLAQARAQTIDIGTTLTVTNFVFDSPAALTAGAKYALSVTLDTHGQSDQGQLRWHSRQAPGYSGGTTCDWDTDTPISDPTVTCYDNTEDLAFTTYMGPTAVAAPELPNTGSNAGTTLTLGGLATGALVAGSLILWRRRTRR